MSLICGRYYGAEPPAILEPNVPGSYSGGFRDTQGYMPDSSYSTYTPSQQPGYLPLPPHPQFPVQPTNAFGGHASPIPRVLESVLHHPGMGHVNNHTRPPPEFPRAPAPDPAQPYPFGGLATQGRPGVPEPPYEPVPSHSRGPSHGGGQYEFASPHASERSYPQPCNPPLWPSLPAQPQPLYDVTREYQAHPPHASAAQPYSLRVGRKKALFVGINYSTHRDRGFRLKWAVHDAREMARFLHESFHFEWSNMQILTDDQPESLPTKANIRAAMRWLVKGAQPGDTLFFYFSGHATQVEDIDEDDSDGLDECMCAMDYVCDRQSLPSPDTPGIIVDDDINNIMVQPLPRGCSLTAVLDCCHSGTLLDLPFIYDSHGWLKPLRNPNVVQQKSSLADVISLSACKDSERAYEVRAEGGALRKAFIEYMKSSGNVGTYYDIIRSLRSYMYANGFQQRPQLSSSHSIDISQRFIVCG
ncbi:caspase domain-containing protein [Lactarius psammicola]|nr:caspase domain-containing protein [Lactarius psammicola]